LEPLDCISNASDAMLDGGVFHTFFYEVLVAASLDVRLTSLASSGNLSGASGGDLRDDLCGKSHGDSSCVPRGDSVDGTVCRANSIAATRGKDKVEFGGAKPPPKWQV